MRSYTDQICGCRVMTSIKKDRGRCWECSVQETKHGVRRGVSVVADPLDSSHDQPGNQGQQESV